MGLDRITQSFQELGDVLESVERFSEWRYYYVVEDLVVDGVVRPWCLDRMVENRSNLSTAQSCCSVGPKLSWLAKLQALVG